MTRVTKTGSLMEQIAGMVPAELLSDEARAMLFASFEADRDLARDPGSLADEIAEHPSRALKWSLLAAAAGRHVADLQLELRDVRARLDARTRQTFTDAGVARATEAMVAASIESDPAWHAAQRAVHEAESVARVCTDLCELMRQRRDFLLEELAQQGAARAPLDRRGATLAEAASLVASRNGSARPHRTPVK
jgi:hypothetical protein